MPKRLEVALNHRGVSCSQSSIDSYDLRLLIRCIFQNLLKGLSRPDIIFSFFFFLGFTCFLGGPDLLGFRVVKTLGP